MNIVCDRCPVATGCCLDFGGKACQKTAKTHGFDSTPTNYEKIRSMTIEEITDLIFDATINDICRYCPHKDTDCDRSFCENKSTSDIIRDWLNSPSK